MKCYEGKSNVICQVPGCDVKSSFSVRCKTFLTFMKALVILSHHDHHFSHLLVFMKKMIYCGSLWALLEYFCKKKLPTAHCFNIGAHIGICAQISRNTLLYLPSLKRDSPILLLMLISAWLTVSRAFNSDEKLLLNYLCLI